jgi:hypothetical protein
VFKKIKFAYDRLPDVLKSTVPLKTCNAHEMELANGSVLTVGTSMRSGTIHRLHISEFGKICAKFPDKAQEVVTGSLPAVPLDGIAIIESDGRGQGRAVLHDDAARQGAGPAEGQADAARLPLSLLPLVG